MKTRLLMIFVLVLGFVGTAYAHHDESILAKQFLR